MTTPRTPGLPPPSQLKRSPSSGTLDHLVSSPQHHATPLATPTAHESGTGLKARRHSISEAGTGGLAPRDRSSPRLRPGSAQRFSPAEELTPPALPAAEQPGLTRTDGAALAAAALVRTAGMEIPSEVAALSPAEFRHAIGPDMTAQLQDYADHGYDCIPLQFVAHYQRMTELAGTKAARTEVQQDASPLDASALLNAHLELAVDLHGQGRLGETDALRTLNSEFGKMLPLLRRVPAQDMLAAKGGPLDGGFDQWKQLADNIFSLAAAGEGHGSAKQLAADLRSRASDAYYLVLRGMGYVEHGRP